MKALKNACLLCGAAFLLTALLLIGYNLHEDRKGGVQADAVLNALQTEIPEPAAETVPPSEDNSDFYALPDDDTSIPEMETVEIDGRSYIGYLTIPDLQLALPVMSEWSYPGLKIAPCRYAGNLYADNLVIAAHNYSSHFGKLGSLTIGAEICFTDAAGRTYAYTVAELERLPGDAVTQMQSRSTGDWDLTLFTCTLSGQERITVRAQSEPPRT